MTDIPTALEVALGSLPEQELSSLKEVVNTRQYAAGSVICYEGEIEHLFYIIQDGTVAFTKKMAEDEQFLGVKGRGEFFGELGILDNAPRAATVYATSDCSLIEIDGETFDDIIARYPSAARAIMRGITRSIRDTDQITISELQVKNEELAQALEELKAAQDELLRRERLKRDVEIASAVHKSILPVAFPSVPNFEFSALARTAREVGGDLYDVVDMGQNQVGILMADASGKSVQAAIYMAVVRALFLSEATAGRSPAETAYRVHELLLKASTAEMFVTAFYAKLDSVTRHMTYIRGGHDRPIYYQTETGQIHLLESPGRFLGLLPDLVVEEESLTFAPGDILVCYSDGVTDAIRETDGEMYGLERLRQIIDRNHHRSASALVEAIVEDIDAFRAGAEQPDDLTLLVTKAI